MFSTNFYLHSLNIKNIKKLETKKKKKLETKAHI